MTYFLHLYCLTYYNIIIVMIIICHCVGLLGDNFHSFISFSIIVSSTRLKLKANENFSFIVRHS